MALTVGGHILAFGANTHGQLGTGDKVDRWKPTRVALELPGEQGRCLRVVQVACGAAFSMALFSNQGSLEVRTAGKCACARSCCSCCSGCGLLLALQHSAACRLQNAPYGPMLPAHAASTLACSTPASMAVRQHPACCLARAGSNSFGQLGLGNRAPQILFTPVIKIADVVAIQAGGEHAAAVTAAGDLFMWGRGDCGQLGLGDMRGKWKPTLVKQLVVVHPGGWRRSWGGGG